MEWRQKSILALGIILIMALGGAFLISYGEASGLEDNNTYYVGGSGPGNYTEIQHAIDLASDGDMVFVFDDMSPYYENIEIDKSLSLVGESTNDTAIHGNRLGTVVTVSADGATISGFTIRNSGRSDYESYAGIDLLNSDNIKITNNRIALNEMGIQFGASCNNIIKNNNIRGNRVIGIYKGGSDDSTDNTIRDNKIEDNGNGIHLDSFMDSTIENNTISNIHEGLSFFHSDNNKITNNDVENNEQGIYFFRSECNKIADNNIQNNNEFGIKLGTSVFEKSDCDKNHISSNIISNNREGIKMYYSSNNTIDSNTIVSNTNWGVYITSSSDNNLIFHNNFIDNNQSAYDACSNYYDKDNDGNYWGDYDGEDKNGDGIGDTSYIGGGSVRDRYPLIKPSKDAPQPPNKSPTCSIYASPLSGCGPLDVTFSLAASDNDGSISSWELDIDNDGSAEYSHFGSPPATKIHTYQKVGTYTAILTVTDDDGDTDTSVSTITVEEEKEGGTPGFGLALLVMAIAAILLIKRRRKNGPI